MTKFGAHLLGKQGPKWSFRSPVLLFCKKQAMVTLSTLVWGFFVAFYPDSEKRGLLWPFLFVAGKQMAAGGNKYLFLVVLSPEYWIF